MPGSELSWRAIRSSIHGAQETFPHFGRHYVPTGDVSRMLKRWDVRVVLEDLPDTLAAVLTPVVFGRRHLLLSRSIPHESRLVVLLHEAGHLFQGTASLGVTYDNEDWMSPAEQMADTFAALALYPHAMLERVLQERIWERDVEDEIAGYLRENAEGLWGAERALVAARNRLKVRSRLGL